MMALVLSRLTRRRWLHFVAAGGFLFLLKGVTAPVAPGAVDGERTITIDAPTLSVLHEEFRRRAGREPDATEEAGLIRHYADDEILYRHALSLEIDRSNFAVRRRLVRSMGFLSEMTEADSAEESEAAREGALYGQALQLGLDKTDPVLRRMLIDNMRLAFRYSALDLTPEDGELQRFLDEHVADFSAPARASFVHVFFSKNRRGEAIAADAAATLAKLRQHDDRRAARGLGDAFAEGGIIRHRSLASLARVFGSDFAPALQRLTPGVWSDPIASLHGLHLVRVAEFEAARPLALDEVRGQVLARWRADRGERRVRSTLEELRGTYTVRVERGDKSAMQHGDGGAQGRSEESTTQHGEGGASARIAAGAAAGAPEGPS
ncbi:MAG: peptidyl-prolyl cis-trans isomerase [Deltaproteobacteria bacterium]|nr:peptidyl-prolyl cis-trans isomerase [Deltaproteobacteria bacterium]